MVCQVDLVSGLVSVCSETCRSLFILPPLPSSPCSLAQTRETFADKPSGYVCLSTTQKRLTELNLTPLLSSAGANEDAKGTAYHLTIDANAAKHPVHTGISAHDRALCSRLVADGAPAADFTRPGHIMTLRYTPGGTRVRTGHTEAAVGKYWSRGGGRRRRRRSSGDDGMARVPSGARARGRASLMVDSRADARPLLPRRPAARGPALRARAPDRSRRQHGAPRRLVEVCARVGHQGHLDRRPTGVPQLGQGGQGPQGLGGSVSLHSSCINDRRQIPRERNAVQMVYRHGAEEASGRRLGRKDAVGRKEARLQHISVSFASAWTRILARPPARQRLLRSTSPCDASDGRLIAPETADSLNPLRPCAAYHSTLIRPLLT